MVLSLWEAPQLSTWRQLPSTRLAFQSKGRETVRRGFFFSVGQGSPIICYFSPKNIRTFFHLFVLLFVVLIHIVQLKTPGTLWLGVATNLNPNQRRLRFFLLPRPPSGVPTALLAAAPPRPAGAPHSN